MAADMTQSMTERVAWAVLAKLKADDGPYCHCGQQGTIRDVTLDGSFDLTELVVVAIAAMREPTEAMVNAGCHHENIGDMAGRWHAMIDAALSALPAASAAEGEICEEIISIMETYHEQDARGFVDTPGGLEHMGDVWSMLARWEARLKRLDGAAREGG